MKIEKQICSLELAKRLKELGVKQDSVFYWTETFDPKQKWHLWSASDSSRDPSCEVSAFTVAELGEMLPSEKFFSARESDEWHGIEHTDIDEVILMAISASTEADCRAKMLIHLIEKGIVKS